MEASIPLMLRLISSSVVVASRAGSEVRRILNTGQLGVVDKGIEDFQTEADRTAQRMIASSLLKRFPGVKLVGEEDLAEDKEADLKLVVEEYDDSILKLECPQEYRNVKEEDITIWVDPLDGTAEFVKGYLNHVTVLIGFSYRGQPVAGVIHQPFYKASNDSQSEHSGRTMWGLKGLGCFGITSKASADNKFIITTTASHGSKVINDVINALEPDQVLRVGGAGYKVLLVMEGEATAYVFASNGSKRWDTCAPEALLRSIGGELTDVSGQPLEYNYRPDANYQNYLGVLATAKPEVLKGIVEKIPRDVKEQLLRVQQQNFKSKF